ncbi:hypothetical protein B0H14DRAFT_3530858 [Mycena olivaceomarginata]|nr:hypothetical protein B0H14DRAFT_3530858 [Mycena olivaceomarginata]
MLDPVTGVSRGMGLFADEADQQRALIQMHGLYCLSRPMRICPATTKFKAPHPDGLPASASTPSSRASRPRRSLHSLHPSPSPRRPASSRRSSNSSRPQACPPDLGADDVLLRTGVVHARRDQHERERRGSGVLCREYGDGAQQQQQPQQQQVPGQRQGDELRNTAQARAILGNLIGPNGEQLTSTDPYNTTVFVGGLSPLVGEETLWTFFVPFGEIHYVKVPVGKHYNAAQSVAQTAQAAALAQAQVQAQVQVAPPLPQAVAPQAPVAVVPQSQANAANAANVNGGVIMPAMLQGMTREQAVMLLQKLQMQGYTRVPCAQPIRRPAEQRRQQHQHQHSGSNPEAYRNGFHSSSPSNGVGSAPQPQFADESFKVRRDDDGPFVYEPPSAGGSSRGNTSWSFSPFSPDPNQQRRRSSSSRGWAGCTRIGGRIRWELTGVPD